MKVQRWIGSGIALILAAGISGRASGQESDQLTAADLAGVRGRSTVVTPHRHLNGQGHARQGIFGIDSLPNFNGHFFTPGFDPFGNPNSHWYYNTVGNPPNMHGTTTINAPVVPVIMDLRNADGTPRFVGGKPLVSPIAQFVQPTLDSPVFQNSTFGSSSVPTQVTDAIHRAEYFSQAKDDWHTLLAPVVKPARTMVLLRGTYRFALNPDGSCCAFIFVDIGTFEDKLFDIIVDAIVTGDETTQDMATFLFPDTYLYFNNDPSQCCVLGFHTYVFDDSDPKVEQRWVLNYSSWISTTIFGAAFTDVTALSHEIAETYNDPFVASDLVHDVTPWWLGPQGNCDDVLETGDVIEGLPNATFPITLNTSGGPFTYHPQNEALLQWFASETPSSAFGGAYSFPDMTVLPTANVSQRPGCQ
jgi:hypothetical protein